jgi:phospholipid/cholesterol/gamma-HCH transport system substrate-binding protein
MSSMPARQMDPRNSPPYTTGGLGLIGLVALVLGLISFQFHGGFTPKTQLSMISARADSVMYPGSKVTYNGVEIGRVAAVDEVDIGGVPRAKLTLTVYSKYIERIPANVNTDISATTVFGSKYVAFTSPSNPTPQRISPDVGIDVSAVTVEFNSCSTP